MLWGINVHWQADGLDDLHPFLFFFSPLIIIIITIIVVVMTSSLRQQL